MCSGWSRQPQLPSQLETTEEAQWGTPTQSYHQWRVHRVQFHPPRAEWQVYLQHCWHRGLCDHRSNWYALCTLTLQFYLGPDLRIFFPPLPPVVGAADPPKVTYMDPTGVVKISRGNQERLTCLTVGSLPLSVMWWHNGSVVHNNSLANISQYLIQNLTLNSGAYSTLIIDNVSEFVEGDYKCVGFNRAGKAQSNPGVQLMLGKTMDRTSVPQCGWGSHS